MKTFRLQESKTTILKKLLKNGNITEEQFTIADDFFNKHTAFEREIDWNRGLNITWDDLKEVIYKERNNKSQAKKKIRKGLEGFTEGKDYIVLEEGEYEGEPWTAYQPFTWEASRMIASHYVEPIEGYNEYLDARWCTAYQKDRKYWDDHNKQEAFIYLCGETVPTKKVAISISEEDYDASGSEFLYSTGPLNYNIWDFNDDNDTIEDFELLDIIPNLYNIIKRTYKNWEKRKPQLIYNLKTNKYDFEGNLSASIVRKYIKPNKNGFIIDFGVIKGDFDCSNLNLKSLKGAPQTVEGRFDCSENKLISLEGAPSEVKGSFHCRLNNLTSLEGAPQKVGEDFDCSCNYITSLEGAPQEVGEDFDCSCNYITSLEGAPQEVGGYFDCFRNKLTSLEGAPQIVGGDFDCTWNELTSLEGAPQTVGKSFDCHKNQLTSLEGAPQKVGEYFNCSYNQLTSLEGAPKTVGGRFGCKYNLNLHSLDGIGEVKGEIIKDF